MATAPNTLAKADTILKVVYEKGVQKQINEETVTLSRIQRTGEGIQTGPRGGKYVEFAIEIAGNHGYGARRENEALPRGRTSTYAVGRRNLTYQYGTIELTGQVMKLANTNEEAYVSILDDEIRSLKNNLTKYLNRQVYGTTAGILVTAASGTTTTLVAPDADVKYPRQDMLVDIWDTSGTAFDVNGPFTITGITKTGGNTTVTFTPAAANAVAVGDSMRIHDSSIDADDGKELTGFGNIINATSVLYNIDPATYPVWASLVNGNSGTDRAVSEGILLKQVHDVRDTSGKVPTVAFWTSGIERSYFHLLGQARSFVNTTNFTGGYETLALTVNGYKIPLVTDIDCPANTIHLVNEKEIKIYREHDWEWMAEDGSRWKQVIDGSNRYDAWTAMLSSYLAMGTRQRNAHSKIEDVLEA